MGQVRTNSSSPDTGTTEQRAKYHLGNTMYAYEFEPKTQQDLLDDKYNKEYYDNLVDLRSGTQQHLFFGHGATQDDFVKRDFGTSNELFYDKKMKTETLINPHFYHQENKTIDKFQTNAKIEDNGSLFGKSGTALGNSNVKHYNQFTKKFDNNYNKMKLRQ